LGVRQRRTSKLKYSSKEEEQQYIQKNDIPLRSNNKDRNSSKAEGK